MDVPFFADLDQAREGYPSTPMVIVVTSKEHVR